MAGRSHVMRDGEIREPSIYLSIFFSSFFFFLPFHVEKISSFGFSGRGADQNIVSSLLIRSQLVGGCPFPFKAIDVRRMRQLEDPWIRPERPKEQSQSILSFDI